MLVLTIFNHSLLGDHTQNRMSKYKKKARVDWPQKGQGRDGGGSRLKLGLAQYGHAYSTAINNKILVIVPDMTLFSDCQHKLTRFVLAAVQLAGCSLRNHNSIKFKLDKIQFTLVALASI